MNLVPYICDGEIIEVNETPASGASLADAVGAAVGSFTGGGSKNPEKRPVVTYKCRIQLSEGQHIVHPMVIDATMFGGIDDYLQIRRRATNDYSKFSMSKPENMAAHVGDRVYIAFIGGNVNRPVIIGSAQHPNQIMRFDEGVGASTKPQMFLRYLGASLVIDEDGQISMTHFGAPTLKYTGSDTGLAGLAAGATEALAAVGGLSGGYEGYEEGNAALDEQENDAVVPQDYKYKTTWEFMKSGMFRIRDSIGQNVTIDPEASTIEITNNGLKSTQSADGGLAGSIMGALGGGEDAEVIRFDKVEQSIFINSRKLTTIYSGDAREDTTVGDYTKEVQGNENITVQGDQTEDVYGGVTRSIYGDLADTISGSVTQDITGDYTQSIMGTNELSITGDKTQNVTGGYNLSVTGDGALDFTGALAISSVQDITIDGANIIGSATSGDVSFSDPMGAGIKISGGKVEVGGAAIGIFAATGKILEQLDTILTAIGAMTVPTGTGPSGPPINLADFTKAQVQLKTIAETLKQVTGSL